MKENNLFIIGSNSNWVYKSLLPSLYMKYKESSNCNDDEFFINNVYCLGCQDLTTLEYIEKSNINKYVQKGDSFVNVLKYIRVPKNYDLTNSTFDKNILYSKFEYTNDIIYISLPPNIIYSALTFLINCNITVSYVKFICDKPFGHSLEEALKLERLIKKHNIVYFKIFDHFMLKRDICKFINTMDELFNIEDYESTFNFYPSKRIVNIKYIEKYSKERLEKRNIFSKDLVIDMFQSHILQMIDEFACIIFEVDCFLEFKNKKRRNITINNIITKSDDKNSILSFKCECVLKYSKYYGDINEDYENEENIYYKILNFNIHLEKHLTKEDKSICASFSDGNIDINVNEITIKKNDDDDKFPHVRLFYNISQDTFHKKNMINRVLYSIDKAIEYWKIVDKEIYKKIGK